MGSSRCIPLSQSITVETWLTELKALTDEDIREGYQSAIVYVRDGHVDDPRPFQIRYWLECGLCTLTKGGKSARCFTKRKEWEYQYFRAKDLSKVPWECRPDNKDPPYCDDIVAASNLATRDLDNAPPQYNGTTSATKGGRTETRRT